jgi:hypothetical protein
MKECSMKEATETIVKVQAPIVSSEDRLLVYAEGRRMMKLHPPESEVIKALGGDLKGYFKAVWSGSDAGWIIGDRVPDQSW